MRPRRILAFTLIVTFGAKSKLQGHPPMEDVQLDCKEITVATAASPLAHCNRIRNILNIRKLPAPFALPGRSFGRLLHTSGTFHDFFRDIIHSNKTA